MAKLTRVQPEPVPPPPITYTLSELTRDQLEAIYDALYFHNPRNTERSSVNMEVFAKLGSQERSLKVHYQDG